MTRGGTWYTSGPHVVSVDNVAFVPIRNKVLQPNIHVQEIGVAHLQAGGDTLRVFSQQC